MKKIILLLKTIAWAIRHPRFAAHWSRHGHPFPYTALLLAFVLSAFSAVNSHAQLTQPTTNQIPANEASFFNDVLNYFSSFNTNLDSTFGTHRGTFFTGVDAIQGGNNNLANTIGIQYEVWKASPSTNTASQIGIELEAVTRNSGLAGTILSQGGGVGLDFDIHDVRVNGYVDGVYQFQTDKIGAEFGVRIFKAIGANTFMGVGIAEQIPGNHQIFSAFVGFVF